MNKHDLIKGICAGIALSTTQVALAHTSLVEKTATAGSKYFGTLNVGHGCGAEDGSHIDTYKLVLDVPDSVSTLSNADLRPMEATWGDASIVKDEAGKITQLVWTKTADKIRAGADAEDDSWGYRASFTVRTPSAPFTKVVFPAVTQYCKLADGSADISTPWTGTAAPTLTLLPAHKAGWNKYDSPVDMTDADIKAFFADALIVWVGEAAYSANPITDSAITNKLTTISTGDVIWVKY